MSETCNKIIFSGGYSQYKNVCGRPAKFEVDGKQYCGIHNPNKAPTKAQIAADANWELQKKKFRLERAAPELLALLIESQQDIGGDWRQRRDAAIAKATGVTA